MDQGDHIRAYSQKVGATYLFHQQDVPPRSLLMTQDDALAKRDETEVLLYFRHPLDRFISAYRFFTQRARTLIARPGMPLDLNAVIHKKSATLPEWAEAALVWEDEHWNSQVEYHTHWTGAFVPNRVVDLAYLGGSPVNTSLRGTFEEELKDFPELRERLEERYKADLEMFERVAGKPDGIKV